MDCLTNPLIWSIGQPGRPVEPPNWVRETCRTYWPTLPLETDPNLLVGRETSDDAGVYKLRDDLALIQTLDFFTPIVNDPYLFGQIAAVNALSDIYAMGGKPLTAMNIVCFPKNTLDKSVLKEILKGGLEKIHEAGALLVGGHSVDDVELKYGLSVTGIVHPDKVMTNAGARPGDQLILTKPIGTGIIATALKGKAASREAEEAMIRVMVESNRIGAEVMQEIGAHGCTDITGFGLLGHALEMAVASKHSLTIYALRSPSSPLPGNMLKWVWSRGAPMPIAIIATALWRSIRPYPLICWTSSPMPRPRAGC